MKFEEKDRPNFSKMTVGQKIKWFWYYYKAWVLIGAAAAFFIIWGVMQVAGRKEDALNLITVNADTVDYDESVWDPFLIDQGFDPKKSQVSVNRNIAYYGGNSAMDVYSMPSLLTILSAGGADCVICQRDCFEMLASLGAFEPVSNIFTPEELAQLDGRIEYVAMDPEADPYISETEEAIDNTYARGVLLQSGSILDSTGFYPPDTELIVALPISADHAVMGQAFMRWLFEL